METFIALVMSAFVIIFLGLIFYDMFWKWPKRQKAWEKEYNKFREALMLAALPNKVYLLLDDERNPVGFCMTEVDAGIVTGIRGYSYVVINRKEPTLT